MRAVVSLILFFGFIILAQHQATAFVVAKTTKDECIVHGGAGGEEEELKAKSGMTCKQKLVVAMTVTANEGSAQKIEANIAKATDITGTQAKNVQLEKPVRITITKSPVIINFRLFQVGQVSNYPHEVMKRKKGRRCRDDWYAGDRNFACTTAKDDKGKKIFDSQGFCCPCDMKGKTRYRGEDVKCYGRKRKDYFGHCLKFDEFKYFVFGFYPPQMQFKIIINIEQLSYSKKDGSEVWESVSVLEVGPHKRIARSKDYGVKVTYIADFSPSEFLSVKKLVHRYLLVPDDIKNTKNRKNVYKGQSWRETIQFLLSRRNVSEWMAINKDKFDMENGGCNKIGVGYSAFRYQSGGCTAKMGSCLLNQPFNFWRQEKEAQRKKKKGQYMLYNFGRIHSLPHTKKLTDYQVNFVADRPAKSFITVSMVADDMKMVVHKSPGRIVESYIEAFEALTTTGELIAIVQNTGKYTATYNVYVLHCSAGIDMVPSDVVTLDPNKMANISFTMHSFSSLGKINNCGVELRDIDGILLDNMTVVFETLDTCFCYGHCGCACGNETTVCPDPPTFDNSTKAENLNKWLTNFVNSVKDFIGPLVSTFGTMSIIVLILLVLGVLKVVHMLITGEIKMPAASEPTQMAMQFAKDLGEKILKEWLPQAYDSCVSSCAKCTWSSYSAMFYILTCGRFAKEAQLSKTVERGWRRPRRCNGMCGGAKVARRNHRKQMRINKRRGMKNETAWFQKPYTCTCKVKDTMPCCQIMKGLCFFYYCPLLPLYWVLQFIYTYIKRKWKRHKRKKKFRETRAAFEAQKELTYLHLDKYSRGKVEREILNLDKDIKTERRNKIIEQSKGFTPDLEELAGKEKDDEQEEEKSSSDTTDVDEVGDIDELLNTGQPVYFNYAMSKAVPKSLVNPGKNFSIMGRLTADNEGQEKTMYTFDLHEYTYQLKQFKKKNKCSPLKTPRPLESGEFQHHIDSTTALKVITVTPLFECLNGAPPT